MGRLIVGVGLLFLLLAGKIQVASQDDWISLALFGLGGYLAFTGGQAAISKIRKKSEQSDSGGATPNQRIGAPTQGTAASRAKAKIRNKQLASLEELPLEVLDQDQEFQDALAKLQGDAPVVFLTGRAGTGKSTFISYLRRKLPKLNIVTVAPTGVAALNVKGQTIHSLFRLPWRIVQESDATELKDKRLFKALDLVIVDEISMVRADVLDGIDQFLRVNRDQPDLPFGGCKMLLVGDLYQLPPILKKEDAVHFKTKYLTEWFFGAWAFRKLDPVSVSLEKVHRQEELVFLDLLEDVRLGRNIDSAVAELNRHCLNVDGEVEEAITLTATNATADGINLKSLKELRGPENVLEAIKSGSFIRTQDEGGNRFPVPERLILKVGAHVMFQMNDPGRRWVNGTLGEVVSFNGETISVKIFESEKVVEVGRHTWEDVDHQYDDESSHVESVVIGEYKQYPIKLAWAITIHKSQGKTFDCVVLDLGRGAFAPGQTYVALSRCKTLEGLHLRNPLRSGDVLVDSRVTKFMKALQS